VGKLTQAAGVGTAATVAPIRKIRYQNREIELEPHDQHSPLERARKELEAIRTGQTPDTRGWLTFI
jgi:branched-chain amino acid aminotransferase